LKQHDRTLRCATPDELTSLALAVLHVDIATGELQAAILERAVDKDPFVKNQVLVFKDFILVSSHKTTRLPLPKACRKRRQLEAAGAKRPLTCLRAEAPAIYGFPGAPSAGVGLPSYLRHPLPKGEGKDQGPQPSPKGRGWRAERAR